MRRLLASLLTLLAFASPASAQTHAYVFGTDYFTGSISDVTLSPRAVACDAASANSDASMRWYAGQLYVVNRFGGDNIQVIDPTTHATVRQFSVGNGSNPHDIAFASATRAYVARFESTDLWIVNPSTGAHTGTISLAAFADADGIPEMDRLMMVGPLLFVSLERVNRPGGFVPTDTSLVAVVDTRADTLVDCNPALPGRQAIVLQLENPFTAFQFDRTTSKLMIGCVGAFGVLDGGIERIDPVALASAGVAITETALGGDVNDVVWGDAQKSWAITVDTGGEAHFVSWRAATGAKLATLWTPGGYSLADAELAGGQVWVASNSFSSPRVRAFSAVTDAVAGPDLVCSLPPVAITFNVASAQVAGVADQGAEAAFSLPSPNPARGGVRFTLTTARTGAARVEAFDAAGRRVRTLLDATLEPGAHAVGWDLADAAGARVAPGLYLVRAAVPGANWTRRVLVVR